MRAKTLFALLAAAALVGAAQKGRAWKTAVVLDAASDTHTESMSTPPPVGAFGPPRMNIPVPVRETVVVILGSDYKYTALQRAGTFNRPCHFVVNDPVQYVKEKGRLRVLDADGLECKLVIQREEHVAPPPVPTPATQLTNATRL